MLEFPHLWRRESQCSGVDGGDINVFPDVVFFSYRKEHTTHSCPLDPAWIIYRAIYLELNKHSICLPFSTLALPIQVEYSKHPRPIQTFKLWTFKDANVCSITVRHEWAHSSPSVLLLTTLQLYHLPPPSLRQAVTLLACSLDASPCMPAAVLNNCTFQGPLL